MPIFEQGYRPYTGTVRTGSRAFAIAWESFRPRMRWWVWLLTFCFLWWPYLILGGITFTFLRLGVNFGGPRGSAPEEAFEAGPGNPLQVQQWIGALTSNSGALFWDVLNSAFVATGPLVLAAVSCGGILASDRRTGALQIYFARPVGRMDYLAGKTLAVAGFCSLLTAIPTLLLWLECVALQPNLDYLAATWWVPFSIAGASLLYTVWTAGVVLAVSSVVKRPVFVATFAIFFFLFISIVGGVLAAGLDEKEWLVLAPHYALGAVTAPLFGLAIPAWLPAPLCAIQALGVPLLCFALVVRRLRAVEVVT